MSLSNEIQKLKADSALYDAVRLAHDTCFESPTFKTKSGENGDLRVDKAERLFGADGAITYAQKQAKSLANNEPLIVPNDLIDRSSNNLTAVQDPDDQLEDAISLQQQLNAMIVDMQKKSIPTPQMTNPKHTRI